MRTIAEKLDDVRERIAETELRIAQQQERLRTGTCEVAADAAFSSTRLQARCASCMPTVRHWRDGRLAAEVQPLSADPSVLALILPPRIGLPLFTLALLFVQVVDQIDPALRERLLRDGPCYPHGAFF